MSFDPPKFLLPRRHLLRPPRLAAWSPFRAVLATSPPLDASSPLFIRCDDVDNDAEGEGNDEDDGAHVDDEDDDVD